MAVYNFDELIQRRGTDSVKWNSCAEDVLPMWVADMDFRTADPIIDVLEKRVRHGVFGYAKVPESYYNAVTAWFGRRHGFEIDKEWILYTSGVVPAISAVIMALTEPGDKVLIQEPVYNCFFSSIRNMRCEAVSNDLVYSGGKYSVDFGDLERKAADPKVKLFLLCSLHNPAGRVWSREELVWMGEICIRHNVLIVSDEIHCDLVLDGHKHIPFASLGEEFLKNSVTCTAPTKTFNIAGIQVANIIAADSVVRERIDKALNVNEICDINCFAIEALQAAYDQGEQWLMELLPYLHENYRCLREFFKTEMPGLTVLPLEATYLVWVDCKSLGRTSANIMNRIAEIGKVRVNGGTMYGKAGEGFIRINIACPRECLLEGLEGIKKALS